MQSGRLYWHRLEVEFQLFARLCGEPLLEQLRTEAAHTLNIHVSKSPWSELIELLRRPKCTGRLLALKQPNDLLHFRSFRWKRATRAFARRIFHIPARRD